MAAVPSSDVTALRAALLNAEAEAARAKAVNADLAARSRCSSCRTRRCAARCMASDPSAGSCLVDQLELGLEELEASAGEDEALSQRAAIGTNVVAFTRARPSRKPLPDHLPRERVVMFLRRQVVRAAGRTGCRSSART